LEAYPAEINKKYVGKSVGVKSAYTVCLRTDRGIDIGAKKLVLNELLKLNRKKGYHCDDFQ
jgi:hypothetical protein